MQTHSIFQRRPPEGPHSRGSEPHVGGRPGGLQLAVQQVEEHGAAVALGGLSQGAVEARLQVADVPQTLLAVEGGEVGGSLVQSVDGHGWVDGGEEEGEEEECQQSLSEQEVFKA